MKRAPAVAGLFYPQKKDQLQKEIDTLLLVDTEKTRAVAGIVPHAGYKYSGKTASYFYKTIMGQEYENIVILGPNHTGLGAPIAIFPEGSFETPLGNIQINSKLAKKIYGQQDFEAHLEEHSIEVQLPFLQSIFKSFKLIPICIGNQSAEEMQKLAESLQKNLTEKDLVIASSDLSHYLQDTIAAKNDMKLIKSILSFDLKNFYYNIEENQSACGYGPIAVAMQYAKGSKAKLLKYDTSATASGDFAQVVGYSSIVFYK